MPVSADDRLGDFAILRAIGEGGGGTETKGLR
jgi:hypothetical protein